MPQLHVRETSCQPEGRARTTRLLFFLAPQETLLLEGNAVCTRGRKSRELTSPQSASCHSQPEFQSLLSQKQSACQACESGLDNHQAHGPPARRPRVTWGCPRGRRPGAGVFSSFTRSGLQRRAFSSFSKQLGQSPGTGALQCPTPQIHTQWFVRGGGFPLPIVGLFYSQSLLQKS